jgi:multiple sugar transport system permease protein
MTAISQERVGSTQAQARRPGWPRVSATVWIHAALIIGLLLVVGPFLWMLLGSFKTTAEIRQVPPTWLPVHPTLQNYTDLLAEQEFPRYFFNSTVVATAITLGNLLFCSMLGYALAKLEFPGKRVLFLLVLGMLMVPGIVTLTPLFVLVTNLHLTNTHLGLILPFLAGPFGVFLMRQFISELPDELMDAARVDGASEYYIFSRIILPLSGPALATLAILTFLASWNNFLWPLVVAQTQDMYTLPVAIALFATGQNQTNFGLLMAGSVIVVVPVLLVFLALQRFFTQGIAMTGFK